MAFNNNNNFTDLVLDGLFQSSTQANDWFEDDEYDANQSWAEDELAEELAKDPTTPTPPEEDDRSTPVDFDDESFEPTVLIGKDFIVPQIDVGEAVPVLKRRDATMNVVTKFVVDGTVIRPKAAAPTKVFSPPPPPPKSIWGKPATKPLPLPEYMVTKPTITKKAPTISDIEKFSLVTSLPFVKYSKTIDKFYCKCKDCYASNKSLSLEEAYTHCPAQVFVRRGVKVFDNCEMCGHSIYIRGKLSHKKNCKGVGIHKTNKAVKEEARIEEARKIKAAAKAKQLEYKTNQQQLLKINPFALLEVN